MPAQLSNNDLATQAQPSGLVPAYPLPTWLYLDAALSTEEILQLLEAARHWQQPRILFHPAAIAKLASQQAELKEAMRALENAKIGFVTADLRGADRPNEAAIHVQMHIDRMFRALGRQKVDWLLIQHAEDLLGPVGAGLWATLGRLKKAGKVSQIGAKLERPEEIDQIILNYPVNFIALPCNLFDQRFSPHELAEAAIRNIEIIGYNPSFHGIFLNHQKLVLPPELLRPLNAAAAAAQSLGLSLWQMAQLYSCCQRQLSQLILSPAEQQALTTIDAAIQLHHTDFTGLAIHDSRLLLTPLSAA